MLPNAHRLPPYLFKLSVNFNVTFLVPIEFFVPIGLTGLRTNIALGTAMPEASIHKYGNFLEWKGKVRLARK